VHLYSLFFCSNYDKKTKKETEKSLQKTQYVVQYQKKYNKKQRVKYVNQEETEYDGRTVQKIR